MKVAVITDTHAGCRNDSLVFNEYFLKFYKEIFFPYLEQHPEIGAIVHMGDVFDRRKFINLNTLSSWTKEVFEKLDALGKPVHILCGNHDSYYKNSNSINSLDELLKDKYKFKIYTGPTTIELGVTPICFLPWICQDTFQPSLDEIEKTKAQICMGHLEIAGFEVYAGHPHLDGFSPSLFQKFETVLTGHFHLKSDRGNIHYLGAPYPMNWSDWGSRKGFHIFDTTTKELEFIENPSQIFHKYYYDDTNDTFEGIVNRDYSVYSGMFVRVIVQKKTNPYLFDQFLEALQKVNPHDVSIVEDSFDDDSENNEEEIDETKDTLSILIDYVDGMGIEHHCDDLKQVLRDLYLEALTSNDTI